jgi:hypothetical protein
METIAGILGVLVIILMVLLHRATTAIKDLNMYVDILKDATDKQAARIAELNKKRIK